MNDDDYFLRGDPKDWKKAIGDKKADPAVALHCLARCKELLQECDDTAANEPAEPCRHLYVDSERHIHTQECEHCGDIREHPARFEARR